MKKRTGIIILVIAIAVSMSGCSKKTASKNELTKEDDPEKILNEALEKLNKATYKAAETKSVTSYDDETEEEEYYTCILDTKKNIVERYSEDADETGMLYHCFNVKEKDGYGVYVNDGLTDGEWKYYKEELEDDEESEYEYWVEEFDLAYTEEKGYSNIEFSNEGEDELNGVKTIKIKVTADEVYDTGEELAGDMTRESVMEEYGWSEDEVGIVDGFSDILDNYVTATNQSVGETTVQANLTLWIDAQDGTLLKSRSAENIGGAVDEATKKAIDEFEEECWKVDMVHQNIEDGMSPEEAKKELDEDIEAMENPVETQNDAEEAGEEFDEEEGLEEYAAVSKIVVTKKIMSGNDCPEMSALPEDYDEISQDEYFEGGLDLDILDETDDYFTEGDEFDDEFE